MVRKAAAVEACDIGNTASEFDLTAARKSCSFSGIARSPGLNYRRGGLGGTCAPAGAGVADCVSRSSFRSRI